ncbi:MAG: PAS domain S-box protein [Gemmatimonadetes bacterium]|nr:PAS domain S-box protein [Gemmatimonadota bacterium]
MKASPPTIDAALVAAILDLSADAILTVSPDERVTSWNHGAQAMFGWTAEEIVGRPFTVLLPGEELARGELEWIHRTTLELGAIRDYATRRKRKDGAILDVSLTRTAVRGRDGQLLGFSAILRDVTDRKRLERQLIASERLATAGQVAAGVAHEIGAPLTAIAMAVDHMLRTRCASCTGAEEMRILQSQTDRIARLARQLVNLAKPAGPSLAPVQANDVIAQALSLVQSQLNRSGVRVSLDLDPGLPSIQGDEAQLQQVIVNLLFNAQRALEARGGNVRIETGRADTGEVEIVVSDDGHGIAAADLPQVFTPFFSRFGGSGLGLALAAQIVRAHRGVIEAASPSGGGAQFIIRLPVANA